MTEMNERISAIGVVPVIKLNHPERDAAGLAKALCAGGVPVAEVTFRAAGAEKAKKTKCMIWCIMNCPQLFRFCFLKMPTIPCQMSRPR